MCGNITRFLRDAIGGVRRFRAHKAGSMATFAAIAAVPLVFSVGAGIDYGSAGMVKAKLDALSDTAALAAVDHQAISGSPADAQTKAEAVFNAEAVNLANDARRGVVGTLGVEAHFQGLTAGGGAVHDREVAGAGERQLHRDRPGGAARLEPMKSQSGAHGKH